MLIRTTFDNNNVKRITNNNIKTMKYFNEETIFHFQFESNYVSKKEIQKQVNEFVEINCEYNSIEDEQMLINTLMKLIYNTN